MLRAIDLLEELLEETHAPGHDPVQTDRAYRAALGVAAMIRLRADGLDPNQRLVDGAIEAADKALSRALAEGHQAPVGAGTQAR